MSDWQCDHPFLRWDFLRSIANNELSKIVGVIPIAGYLILFNDGLSQSISFNTIAGIGQSEPKPFFLNTVCKLRLTFFGSIFILAANIIFRTLGPKVIGNSPNEYQFAETVVSSYAPEEIHQLESDVLKPDRIQRTPLLCKSMIYGGVISRGNTRLSGIPRKRHLLAEHEEYIRLLAREWWGDQLHTRKLARVTTLIFCLIGYTALAIPSIDIAQAVIRDLF